MITRRCASSSLSGTPLGNTTVTSPFGSGRRKWRGSGTSSVVPFIHCRVTFSISNSWRVNAFISCSHPLHGPIRRHPSLWDKAFVKAVTSYCWISGKSIYVPVLQILIMKSNVFKIRHTLWWCRCSCSIWHSPLEELHTEGEIYGPF